jgi:hypothetical protein
MPPVPVSSKFWRDRAADMRAMSGEFEDSDLKRVLQQMADDYDAFAVQRDLLKEDQPPE